MNRSRTALRLRFLLSAPAPPPPEKERKKVEKEKGVWYTLPILKTRHIFLCKFLKGERF